MHPRLLDIYANSFPDDNIPNGLGILSDCVSGFVEEEINGSYELELEYPVDGINSDKLGLFKIIYIPNDVTGVWQPFRIYKIEQRGQDIKTVYARHLTYDLDGFVEVFQTIYNSQGNVVYNGGRKISRIFDFMQRNIVYSSGSPASYRHVIRDYTLTYSSDKTISSGWILNRQGGWFTFRNAMAGTEGSIVDLFGGEWKFNKWNSHWINGHRGSDNDVTLMYGKNLTDCEIEVSTTDFYTDLACYIVTQDGVTIGSSGQSIVEPDPFDRTLPVDLAEYFQSDDPDDTPTSGEVIEKGREVAENWGLGKVSQSIKVSGTTLLEQYGVVLGDTVHVVIPSLGIDQKTRLRKARWDFLNECYTDVEFGEATNRYKLATNDRFEVK